jgi:HEPN domain
MDESKRYEVCQWLIKILTPYATEFRYPGDAIEPEKQEAERALEMAEFFVGFVMSVFPDEVTQSLEY